MKTDNSSFTARAGRSSEPSEDPAVSGINRREFLNFGLAAAALLALSGCASLRGPKKSDFDKATTDLRNLLDEFEGDGARQARLASLGRRIENRCQEVIEEHNEFRQRLEALSRRRETPSAELKALVEEFSARRTRYRAELLGAQDELRRALTREEWDQVVQILNSGADAFSRTRTKRI